MQAKSMQIKMILRIIRNSFVLGVLCAAIAIPQLAAQVDQGSIAGVVQDTSGAIIQNAHVTVTDTDTGLALHGKTDRLGLYAFSPLKIGNYEVTASAPGFETTTQKKVYLHAQERLSITLQLKPGAASETVVVNTAPPLLETESNTVGQVMDTKTINNVPLNGRNWVYIAQLAAGVVPSTGMSNGAGTGDFFANGQRASQNNFILNGMDNNAVVDGAGTSYTQEPPPDALSEFSISTTNYDAEYGFSAGAVVNASIKSGTNQIHGSLWEYVRNTALDATDWENSSVAPYHENQFGATLGLPILHNKLFYFGDVQANLISFNATNVGTVPTALMRNGDFSELLNPSLTGQGQPIQLYEPNSGGAQVMSCNGKVNVLCSNQIDPVAQTLINLYPAPNTNNGDTYNNYITTQATSSHTWQWDQRLDWNISEKDRAYTTLSYNNNIYTQAPFLGYVLDGGSALNNQLAESGMISETHVFTPTLTNEVRLAYNWANFSFLSINPNVDVAAKYGISMPFGAQYPDNGGLPDLRINGLSNIGTSDYEPNLQRQNELQIQDNVIKVIGAHTLKFGLNLQPMRIYFDQPAHGRGSLYYTGYYTSNLGGSYSGTGLADFFTNNMNHAWVSPNVPIDYYRWYRAAYAQDQWRATKKLTLNLGVRYDLFQPISQQNNGISNITCQNCSGIGTGSATLLVPTALKSLYATLPQNYFNLLQQSNVAIQYQNSKSLSSNQKTNFAPRVGFVYQLRPNTVLSGGLGVFYGGAEAFSGLELSLNYPFAFTNSYIAGNCAPNNCPSLGVTFENGFWGGQNSYNNLLQNVTAPTYDLLDVNQKTPYTESYNLAIQQALTKDMTATISYVGNESRHLGTLLSPNNSNALQNPANSGVSAQPFPLLGNFNDVSMTGFSRYNSLQAKVEQRYADGLSLLATYTWSHAMDDSVSPSGIEAGTQDRNTNLIPIADEYTNSAFDVRQRLTFNTYYELPFGLHRRYLNHPGVTEELIGGWAADVTFAAQTGVPFSVGPDISTASQSGSTNAYAILVGDPFKGGGNAGSTNPGVTCPATVKNRNNWYNPCAFANPLPGTNIPISGPGSLVTGLNNAIAYLGGRSNVIHGPGYARANMSLFKGFTMPREQTLEFRADIFNLTNTPSLGNPSNNNNSPSGGQITGPKSFQNLTPDSRFFQLSLRYAF